MRMAAAVLVALSLARGGAAEPPAFRLPDTVRPERYRLELTLKPESGVYGGRVEIDVQVVSATDVIWLNGKDLLVKSAWIQRGAQRHPANARLEAGEFIGLSLGSTLEPGRVRLGLEFTGALNEKASTGLYRRSDGRRWYAFTAFTAIEARRAFPCFDQPEFKTPWRIALHVPESDVAVANSRELSRTHEPDGMKRVVFAETKLLSTEVVAFAVGPFDVVDDGTAGKNRVPVRILTPQGRGREAAGALGGTRDVLARLEEYTGVPYMWDKLDHLAALDMPFGAIENPGLITYRDRILLAPPRRDTPDHRQAMRGTIAHELAHQWFGNLVTQKWWDDVWLSEGFASWLGVKVSDIELPESQRGIAAVESRWRIMAADTRPVRVEMRSRKEMDDIYSGIVYQKGAGVLRMVEQWLGPDAFRRGLQRYLQSHAYGTATSGDLTAALSAASGLDVGPVLDSFLNQPGYPTVRVAVDCAAGKARVVQSAESKWKVPVCVQGRCEVVGLAGDVPIAACPAWANAGGSGYFRAESDSLPEVLHFGWETLTTAERVDVAENVAWLPADKQLSALPILLRDRDPHVVTVAQRMALKLMAEPEWREKVNEVVSSGGRGRR